MAQSWEKIEHIVIDGGSSDRTTQILKNYEKKYNLSWESKKDNGQSDAINRGFDLASGEIVYWLNSDDALVSRLAIEKIVKIFQENPKVDIVFGNRIVVDADNNLIKLQYTGSFNYKKVCDGTLPIFQENVFFRSHVIKKEKINVNLRVVMDTDYWVRLGKNYNFLYVPDIYALFRIHDTNKTVSEVYAETWNKEKDYLKKKYGIHRYKVGVGAQPLRYIHRAKALLTGSYNNYIFIYKDIIRLQDAKDLVVTLNISKSKIITYIKNSFRPYVR